MRKPALPLIGFVAPILVGCAIPVLLENKEISDQELMLIEQGKTTRGEVIARLGEPDIIWA